MKLSRTERWVLANQYRIMAALYPDQGATYRSYAEALERGYANAIDRFSAHVVRDDTSHKESDEVDEILDLFYALQRSFRTMEDPYGIDDWRLHFPGFDRKTEEDYLGYAHFSLSHEGRYPNLTSAPTLDTGRPMLRDYRRMVEEWKKRGGSNQLDREDVVAILDAQKQK
jgi:hypothetical protein